MTLLPDSRSMSSCFRYLASVQHIDIYFLRLRPTFLRGQLISKKANFAMLKYLSSAIVAVFLAIMASGTTMAQTDTSSISESSEPLQVAFGAYVLRISHVSPKEGSADVDMWVWFRWKNSDLRPDLTFEIANGVITSRSESDFYSVEDYKVASVRVQAEIFQDFDVNRYPLDNHTIQIKIEDAMMPNDGLVFTADEDSALDQGVNVAGWAVALPRGYRRTLCLPDRLRLAWQRYCGQPLFAHRHVNFARPPILWPAVQKLLDFRTSRDTCPHVAFAERDRIFGPLWDGAWRNFCGIRECYQHIQPIAPNDRNHTCRTG